MSLGAINDLQNRKDVLENAALDYSLNERKEALERLLEAGNGLVTHYVRQYSGGSIIEDLKQSGYEGLIKAAKRYDPSRQIRFSTFASHYIMGEIRHEINREARFDRSEWIIRVQNKINNAIDELRQQNNQEPTLKEISEFVNIQEEGIVQAMLAGRVPLDEIDFARIRNIRYNSFQLPIEDKIIVRQAMQKLSEVQKQVVYLIFYKDFNQTQVAERLGINQRRVSRILNRALTKLRYLIIV